jgi:LuxR family maltose regulon positive regulatory protein
VPAPDPVLIGELSPREIEVLQHLAEMLSTAEIAAAMFVSVNTVRTHIRSILRKLGATRRNEAVRRARQLEIL